MTNLTSEIEAQTEAAAICGDATGSPADKKPWLFMPKYFGMSPQSAELSYRAGEKRRNEEKVFAGDQLFRAIPAAAPGIEAVTEDSAALAFRGQYNGQFLFDHDLKTWFVWDDCRWALDKTALVFDKVRQLVRELTKEKPPQTKFTANRTSFAAGVEKFATSDRAFAVITSEWDTDVFLLGTPGGTVNLRDGALRPASSENRITKLTAVSPAEIADCPIWLNFLYEATGCDEPLIRLLQQLCGYALTGSVVEHVMAFVYGGGGNGKSVFINTVSGILGEYAATAAMTTFTASRSDAQPRRALPSRLRGQGT
jgi:putative DNA primase/helicase